jgi:hypothetical protein
MWGFCFFYLGGLESSGILSAIEIDVGEQGAEEVICS